MKINILKNFYLLIQITIILLAFSSCKNGDTIRSESKGTNTENKITPKDLEHLAKDHDPYFFSTFDITSKFGPNSISRNIIQDKKGNFWFATWQGIMHYDGRIFTNYTNKSLLRRWHAFAVMEDSQENIWFGTIGGGVYLFDGDAYHNITVNEGLANDNVTSLYEDTEGKIWFGTLNGASCHDPRISKIPNKESIRNLNTKDGLPNADINSIVQDNTGRYWFGTRGQAVFYDGDKFTIFTKPDGNPFTNVRSIIKDRKGKMWLGGNDGLWSSDGETFSNYGDSFVGYIYEDSKGDILTSSVGDSHNWNLYRYKNNSLYDITVQPDTLREQIGQLFGIIEDSDGKIWFGHEYGVCSIDKQTVECYNEFPFPYEE